VELHPSHFVAGGLPNVQRTADEIFTKLMELDRCVVLFDEIDELMRERETEPDAFGRFLTTSMLPKLAELWKEQRIIYFVATNHIGLFDRALTRSQRFDALIVVPPPAFAIKKKRLLHLLETLAPDVMVEMRITASDAKRELDSMPRSPDGSLGELHDEHLLAKFILLRWDQLDELAHILIRAVQRRTNVSKLLIDVPTLKSALREVSDNRLKEYAPYAEFIDDRYRVGRDFGKDVVWLVEGNTDPPKALRRSTQTIDGRTWCIGTRELLSSVVAPGEIDFSTRGRIKFRRPSATKSRRASGGAGPKPGPRASVRRRRS
jgi:hypothetical protein